MVTKQAIYNEVDDRRDEIVSLLSSFLEIQTENPPGKNYREGASFLDTVLSKRGYDVELIDVPENVVERHYPERSHLDRVNVLGQKSFGDGPNIHYTGHYDVVPAGEDWTKNPFDPTIEGDRIYGRGASDMKSGIVASLFAIDVLEAVDAGLEGSVTQSMTVDEETGGFTGLGYLAHEGYLDGTDYCVYTECFDSSRVCLGHRGVLKFKVVTHGRKAHGCMAHDGINAVSTMNDFLTRIEEYRTKLHQRSTDLPVTPSESQRADISVTMMDAGYSENVVPDRCTATFYRVLVPTESVADVRNEIRELIGETEDSMDASLDYDEIMFAEPTNVSQDCKVSQTFARNVDSFHGNTEFVISPGSDDQRFVVNDAGIDQCIVYGPGRLEQAHVEDEYASIEDILTAIKVMAVSTAQLIGDTDE
ncbi:MULTISPECIES: ArgE/DapE family deacylase [unclassified Haladaptatus]|uniref:ArgE/DapE family deacylase n=1 Tax=unclassified Haladaptatus TaxID=2622732 RepID=UPI00209C0B86|nr:MULTISPECIES: ArgE/DapE family deacylase [unclassified Haladaptatus]MCO8244731.1 ArgE/DapE family deacylase [Haladaptatus sp. AB643]MCO8255757.1 ArgE/DapE family deacylase [Haladaptatus sp. AB618]